MKEVDKMNDIENPGTQTRTYVLANPEARKNINLLDYEKLIIDTVHEFLPDALVTVTEYSYTVVGITRGAAIKIVRKLSKFFDSNAFLINYSLFISSEGTSFRTPFITPIV